MQCGWVILPICLTKTVSHVIDFVNRMLLSILIFALCYFPLGPNAGFPISTASHLLLKFGFKRCSA